MLVLPRIAAMTDRVRVWAADRGRSSKRPDLRRALVRAAAVTRVNELLNWNVARDPVLTCRRLGHQGLLLRHVQAIGQ